MTVATALHGELPEAEHRSQLRKAVIASTIGTTIEWYDFLLYSTVTGLVFGKLFFPHSDPLVGVLEAFAVYTVGFIARPIGAAIFGHYGDRIGRKASLIATLLITGLATGYKLLDEYTSGLQAADLIVLAARPGMGKTSFALNIAQHVGLREGKRVGVFSLEMTREQLFLRMLTGLARVDSHRLRTGRLTKEEWKQLTRAFGELAAARAFIDDKAGISVLEMRAQSRRLKMEQGLDLVVIDYMQLIRSRGRFENRQQEMAEISRSLKELAKELNVPVIAVSQLSRAPEQRGEKGRPQLSDLRESGAIEQDADVVLLLYREEMYKPTEENRGIATVIIAKQRNGPTAEFDMAFIREYTRFEDLERQPG